MASDQGRSVLDAGTATTEPPRGNSPQEPAQAPVHPAATEAEDVVIASASSEIKLVAGAIAELQTRLERALSELDHITAVRTTETEIGRLFVEAQRFTETALGKLETQVADLLAEATAKAERIIQEANEDAERIRHQANGAHDLAPNSNGTE